MSSPAFILMSFILLACLQTPLNGSAGNNSGEDSGEDSSEDSKARKNRQVVFSVGKRNEDDEVLKEGYVSQADGDDEVLFTYKQKVPKYKIITCITVSRKDDRNASVTINYGGLNNTNVQLAFENQSAAGFSYFVQIFGRAKDFKKYKVVFRIGYRVHGDKLLKLSYVEQKRGNHAEELLTYQQPPKRFPLMTITCISVSQKDIRNASVNIKYGGVNDTKVQLGFRSETADGFNYMVKIYGMSGPEKTNLIRNFGERVQGDELLKEANFTCKTPGEVTYSYDQQYEDNLNSITFVELLGSPKNAIAIKSLHGGVNATHLQLRLKIERPSKDCVYQVQVYGRLLWTKIDNMSKTAADNKPNGQNLVTETMHGQYVSVETPRKRVIMKVKFNITVTPRNTGGKASSVQIKSYS